MVKDVSVCGSSAVVRCIITVVVRLTCLYDDS